MWICPMTAFEEGINYYYLLQGYGDLYYLMFARIGAVFGSNSVAYFSNNYYEATFYTI